MTLQQVSGGHNLGQEYKTKQLLINENKLYIQ